MRTVELKAPEGKFRVVGVDTFDGTDWVEGDFNSQSEACLHAMRCGGEMLKMHVYDDAGRHIAEQGKY